jgi:hypothetical protein
VFGCGRGSELSGLGQNSLVTGKNTGNLGNFCAKSPEILRIFSDYIHENNDLGIIFLLVFNREFNSPDQGNEKARQRIASRLKGKSNLLGKLFVQLNVGER